MEHQREFQWTLLIVTKKPNGKDEAYDSLRFYEREAALKVAEHVQREAGRGGNLVVIADGDDGRQVSFLANNFLRTRLEKYSPTGGLSWA